MHSNLVGPGFASSVFLCSFVITILRAQSSPAIDQLAIESAAAANPRTDDSAVGLQLSIEQPLLAAKIPCDEGNYSHCTSYHGRQCCVDGKYCGGEDDCLPIAIVSCTDDDFSQCQKYDRDGCCYQNRRCGTPSECEGKYYDVECRQGNFSHCPTEDGVQCCLLHRDKTGRCGRPEDCRSLTQLPCTQASSGQCPSYNGVSCCGSDGYCGSLAECEDQGRWPPLKVLSLLSSAMLVMSGLVCVALYFLRDAGEDEDHFAPGVVVFLHGVDRNPELNGQIATIEAYDGDHRLWNVKMRTGASHAVRRSNLILARVPGRETEMTRRS